MPEKIDADTAHGTPPVDFDAFPAEVVTHLLGLGPTMSVTSDTPWGGPREFRAEAPERQWPRSRPGWEYFYRGLVRLLWERHGTAEAADSIRHQLEDGTIRAVVIDDNHGEEEPIPPRLWRAAKTSAEMYWTGRAAVSVSDPKRRHTGLYEGDIYLTEEPAPKVSGALPTKAVDLRPKERISAYKLILGLAAGGYSYKPSRPGERTKVVSEIVGDLERFGFELSDETVRKWLTDAYEALGRPELD
jgi:hypothetical protein